MAVKEQDYYGFALNPSTGKRHTLRHLPEDSSEWEPQVYLLEEGDKVLGGIQGVVNLPLQQLTNRTAYLHAEVAKRGAVSKLITLAPSGWKNSDTGENTASFLYEVSDADITADMIPMAVITPGSLNAAQDAGINQTVQTQDGKLLIWADKAPDSEITIQLTLFAVSNSIAAGDVSDNAETLTQSDIDEVISGVYDDDGV